MYQTSYIVKQIIGKFRRSKAKIRIPGFSSFSRLKPIGFNMDFSPEVGCAEVSVLTEN
jgi:hypothetical protein